MRTSSTPPAITRLAPRERRAPPPAAYALALLFTAVACGFPQSNAIDLPRVDGVPVELKNVRMAESLAATLGPLPTTFSSSSGSNAIGSGAAKLWVRVDPRGRWVQHAGKIDAVVREMFEGIEGAGRSWLFAYPELPNELRAGERWQGLRALPLAGEPSEVRLDYRVREVADEHAVIEIHTNEEMDLPGGLRGRVRVDGTSRIRRGDGAFLGGSVTMSGSFTGEKGGMDLRSRIETTCAAG